VGPAGYARFDTQSQLSGLIDILVPFTHRGLDLDPPLPRAATWTAGDGEVIRRDVLSGIVHEYERAA